MNKFTINNTILEIQVNDLTKMKFDAIVIPANSRLLPSGELRCEVLRRAGAKVQQECNKKINKLGVLPVGTAIMTSAGNLSSKYIIHTIGPKIGQGKEGKKLMLCVWNSLILADKSELESIAFDPIAIENVGFNAKICSEVILPAIKKYLLENNKNLKHIAVILNNLPDYKEFENVLNKLAL